MSDSSTIDHARLQELIAKLSPEEIVLLRKHLSTVVQEGFDVSGDIDQVLDKLRQRIKELEQSALDNLEAQKQALESELVS